MAADTPCPLPIPRYFLPFVFSCMKTFMNDKGSEAMLESKTKDDGWTPIEMHCPNCGAIVIGHRNTGGMAKMECGRCRTCMVSKRKNRRHEQIDVYAPPGPEVIC